MSPRIHQQAASRPHAIDAHSQGILEYAKVKAMLAGYAASSLGRSAIGTLEPMTRFDLVSTAVAETSELRAVLQRKGRLPMAGMTDVRPVVAGEEGAAGIIEPHALRAVRNALLAACELKLLFEEEAFTSPHLARLGEQLGDFSHIADAVDAVVDNDGTVRDDASPALMVLRRRLQAAEARIRDRAHALARSAELRPFLQDSTVGVRQGHYVLAVRVECKHQVDGIVHDRSQSGASAYMEPRELVVMANELEDVRFQERREVSRLLRDLTLAIRAERDAIGHTLDTLAHVDLTYAKARFAIDYDMAAPEINDAGKLDVRRARHPILIRVLERDEDAPSEQKVVPIDYRLGEDFDLLVVTGPNTGGKTVGLKTIGLLSLMVQSGMHVPAASGSVFPIYEDVLADIGDEQSIEQSLSTFSSHMTNIVRILASAHRRSLVLLDELGAGTDPVEGAAIATAVLDHLGARNAKTVVTTHIGELKAYAYSRKRTMNAACEFDERSLRPTYRLLLGQPGSSNAVAIAERLGLPKDIVRRARALADKKRGPETDLVADLQRTRSAIEEDRELAHDKLQEAEQLRAGLDAKVKEAKRRAATCRAEAQREVDEQAKQMRQRILDALRQMRNAPAPFGDRVRDIERLLEDEVQRTPLAAKRLEFAHSLKRDDFVHVIPFGQTCRVRTVNRTKKRLQVVLGNSLVEVSFEDVTWVDPPRDNAT